MAQTGDWVRIRMFNNPYFAKKSISLILTENCLDKKNITRF